MKTFDWIKQFYKLREEKTTWNSVSDIIPNDFDDYFLIHWNVGIVDGFPFDEYPDVNENREESIEEINQRIRINEKFGLSFHSNENKHFRPISLKAIAEMFNTNYDYNVMNSIKQTPAIKILEETSIQNLKKAIQNLVIEEELYFFVEDIFRYPSENKLQQGLVNISVDDYFDWQKDFHFDYCTYLFPNNKEWCITTSEDLSMFLCVKKEVTKLVVQEFELELFKIEYEKELFL